MFILVFIFVFLSFCEKKTLLIGGGLDEGNLEVFHTLLSMPGKTSVKVAVITAASEASVAEENGKYYIGLFKKNAPRDISVDPFWVPIDTEKIDNNKNPKVVSDVKSSDIVFFGGGDQERLMECLVDRNTTFSPVLEVITKNYEDGKSFVSGTSAGTAIQTDPKLGLVTGGESYYAFRNGVHEKRDPDHPDDLSYMPGGGFGFVKGFLTDTHFSDRGREGRIIILGVYVKADWVIGVDQNTAVLVKDDSKMKVMGESGVFFFDLRNSTLKEHVKEYDLNDVYATYLTEGDEIDFGSGRDPVVTFASYKRDLKGREEYHDPMRDREDIWSSPDNENERRNPKEFALVAQDLCNCKVNTTKGTSYHSSPVQTVHFEKVSDTERFEGDFQQEKKISFHKMKIDVSF